MKLCDSFSMEVPSDLEERLDVSPLALINGNEKNHVSTFTVSSLIFSGGEGGDLETNRWRSFKAEDYSEDSEVEDEEEDMEEDITMEMEDISSANAAAQKDEGELLNQCLLKHNLNANVALTALN